MKRIRALIYLSGILGLVSCPANLFMPTRAGGASPSGAACQTQTGLSDLSSPLQATDEGGRTASQLNQFDQVGEDIL